MKEIYPLTANLKNKKIHFRKWKVKDKKEILKNKDNPEKLKTALVYNCLKDKNIVLTKEEYKYLLLQIRFASLKENIVYNFECKNCKSEFEYIANIDEIAKPKFSKENLITVGEHTFEMQRIQNREFYENSLLNVSEAEADLIEFIFSIKSYNSDDVFGFEELNEIINDLDIDIFSEIFSEWNRIKFRIDNVHSVKCPKCSHKTEYEFDYLPGFFPESWDI